VIYCTIPPELADRLHEPLRRHFAGRDDIEVEVIVERRAGERRGGAERRAATAPDEWPEPEGEPERRQVRAAGGRRAGDRRAPLRAVAPAELPRRARRYAERIAFYERREPPTERAEDRDTARVVGRFQAGDKEAFSTLYTRYFSRVYNYLRVAIRDHHEAEDLTQQVFTQAFASLPKYERRKQPFRAWLFKIARNAALRQLQRQARVELVDPAELDEYREAGEVGEAAEMDVPQLDGLDWITDGDLHLFVERLPLPQRQVLTMHYMLGLRSEEIARVLGRKPSDVRMLHHRGLEYLRERLGAVRAKGEGKRQDRPIRRCGPPATVIRNRRYALLDG
jgi:RNA polymerase sigma-70 factor (ECF subfamily)